MCDGCIILCGSRYLRQELLAQSWGPVPVCDGCIILCGSRYLRQGLLAQSWGPVPVCDGCIIRCGSRYLRQELEEEPSRQSDAPEEPVDPLPEKLLQTARVRLKSDGLACSIIGVMVFAVHCSTVSGSRVRAEGRVVVRIGGGVGGGVQFSLGFMCRGSERGKNL